MLRPVIEFKNQQYKDGWDHFYKTPSDRVRTREEGIWRRTQTPRNASESDWKSDIDSRRRVIHYLYNFSEFDRGGALGIEMSQVYFNYSTSLPPNELAQIKDDIFTSLSEGGWTNLYHKGDKQVHVRDDLTLVFNQHAIHPIDIQFPYGFITKETSIDVTISTHSVDGLDPLLPWKVLKGGMRTKELRGNPEYVPDLEKIVNHLPFHVEVGCGISLEAGIPALHRLHELYRVTDLDTGKFIFGGKKDDIVPRIIKDPHEEFVNLCEIFTAAFSAEPTKAHAGLVALQKSGAMVGPIMTNNFDGLAHRAGLEELYLRRYDESVPPITFDENAKSLLVIGSHADRRRVQSRARDIGMTVFYLDPEGYFSDGKFFSYPLEGPLDKDFVCKKDATFGVIDLCKKLGINP